jgi:nitrate/nitrite transport system ATP-binding protein
MMTNGPAAGIGEDLPITLERPRDRIEAAELPEYYHARHAILHFLHQRYSNPLDEAA